MFTIVSAIFVLVVGGGLFWSWINIRDPRKNAERAWQGLQIELAIYLGEIENDVKDKDLLSKVRKNLSSPSKASKALEELRSKENIGDPSEALLDTCAYYNGCVFNLDKTFQRMPQKLFLCRSCVGFEPF